MKPFDTDRFPVDDYRSWPPPPQRLRPMEEEGLSPRARLAIAAALALLALGAVLGAIELGRAYAQVETEQPVAP